MLRTFEPKRDKRIGSWRRLHNAELRELYSLLNIIRMIQSRSKMMEHVACKGRRGILIRVLMGKPESERPVRKSRHEWVDQSGTGYGPVEDPCEHSTQHKESLKYVDIL